MALFGGRGGECWNCRFFLNITLLTLYWKWGSPPPADASGHNSEKVAVSPGMLNLLTKAECSSLGDFEKVSVTTLHLWFLNQVTKV